VVVNEVETRDARGSEKTGGIHPGTWPMLFLVSLHASDVAIPRMDHMTSIYPYRHRRIPMALSQVLSCLDRVTSVGAEGLLAIGSV
jgi:hypothetical protein